MAFCPECTAPPEHLYDHHHLRSVCHEHKAKWFVNSYEYSQWREQTSEQYKQDRKLLKTYKNVSPPLLR